MLIGVCGRSGSGKTTICRELAALGAYVIDADIISREIMNGDIQSKVQNVFPECFENGVLNRRKLAAVVFDSDEKLAALNSITHPEIRREIQRRIDSNSADYEYIIVDAAVLLEAGMKDMFDCTVAVTAPDDVRIDRIVVRDSITLDDAELRVNAQRSEDYYISNSDFSIVNDGKKSPESLAEELLRRSCEFVFKKNNS